MVCPASCRLSGFAGGFRLWNCWNLGLWRLHPMFAARVQAVQPGERLALLPVIMDALAAYTRLMARTWKDAWRAPMRVVMPHVCMSSRWSARLRLLPPFM